MKYLFLILPIISILLIGCGDDSNPQTEESNTSDPIIGSWVSNCYQAYFDPEDIKGDEMRQRQPAESLNAEGSDTAVKKF